jgi:hypothetical protein
MRMGVNNAQYNDARYDDESAGVDASAQMVLDNGNMYVPAVAPWNLPSHAKF